MGAVKTFEFIELILFRWKLFLLIILLVTTLISSASFLLLQLFPVYETELLILIKPDPDEILFSNEVNPLNLADPVRTVSNTYSGILMSWTFARKVVDSLLTGQLPAAPKTKFKVLYEAYVTPVLQKVAKAWFTLNFGEFRGWPTKEEALTRELIRGMRVTLLDDTYFIHIKIEGESPNKVALVGNALGNVFSEHIKQKQDFELESIIQKVESDIAEAKSDLRDADEMMSVFKKQEMLVDPDFQTAIHLEKLENTDLTLLLEEAQIKEVEGRLAGLTAELDSLTDRYLETGGAEITPDIALELRELESLERKLVRAELEPDDGRSYQTLSGIAAEIRPVREGIREMVRKSMSRELGELFPDYPTLAGEIAKARTETYSRGARRDELSKIKEEISEEINRIPSMESVYLEFSRNVIEAENRLKFLNMSLEDAILGKLLNISNVMVVDPAEVPKYPAFPKVLVLSVFGIFAGILCAGMFILFIEFRKGCVRSVEESSMTLDAPHLATIFPSRG